MTRNQYRPAIRRAIKPGRDVPEKAIRLIDAAVSDHPKDASLWHKRAILIQLGPESGPHTLEDALASYFTALYLDPQNPEIVEDIGHFFDAVMGHEKEGQRWLIRGRRMKANNTSDRIAHPGRVRKRSR